MAKFFRNNKKQGGYDRPRATTSGKAEDLMDPILYVGGLDPAKYPVLAPEKERKPKEEPENPLNKR